MTIRRIRRPGNQNKVSYRKQMSAFAVDHVQIFLTSSLITVQNLVVVSHTVCAYVGVPKIWGMLGPHPLADPLEICFSPPVSMPYLVILCQTGLCRSARMLSSLTPNLSCHSRSLEPTWVGRLPVTSY